MQIRRALLIGAGGFGLVHLNALVRMQDEGLLTLEAAADPKLPEPSASIVKERGIKHYIDYRAMLEAETGADFVIVSTPIHLHVPMSVDAMEAGFHVLLEKPPGAMIQDVDFLLETARRTEKLRSASR